MLVVHSTANAGDDRELLSGNRSDDRQRNLTAVRVAGENERHIERCGFGESPRIVGQQDDRAGRATHERGDITPASGPVSDADQFEGLVVDHDARARVPENLHAVRRERGRHVVIVVVIAEDAVHAVRRRQRIEGFG